MSKYKEGNYIQLSRELFNDDRFKGLSLNAKWLYVVLNELEHKFTRRKENYFFRSNEDLANDTGLSISSVKRAKEELRSVVQMWQMHWKDTETGKLSKKKITAFRIKE